MTKIDTIADGVTEGLPVRHIEAFLDNLRTAGYAEATLREKQWILTAFARWMKSNTIALVHLDESAIALVREALNWRVDGPCSVRAFSVTKATCVSAQ